MGIQPVGTSSGSILKLQLFPSFSTRSRKIPFASLFYIFCFISCMYIKPQGKKRQPLGTICLMQAGRSYHIDHWLHVSKNSSATFFHDLIHVHSPWAGADNPLVPKVWSQQEGLITMVICCKFKKNLQPLTLYTSFHDLINVYSCRSGADNPSRQNFDVNRNLLSLRSFPTNLKKPLWSLILYSFFHYFIHVYSPGQGMSTGTSCHFGHLLQVSTKSLWSLILYIFFSWFYTCI